MTPRKTVSTTGITRTFEWTPELRAAVDMAKEARPIEYRAVVVLCQHRRWLLR